MTLPTSKLHAFVLSLLVLSCAQGSGLDSSSDQLGDGQGDGDGNGDGDGDGLGDGDGNGNGNGNGNGTGPTGSGGAPATGNGGAAPGLGGAGPSGGDCCTPLATPGCGADPAVEACVCAQDDYCCMTEWDDTCVGEVDQFGCGSCGGGLGGSGPGLGGSDPGLGGGGPTGGACCTPEATPGCAADPAVEDCVCFFDPYCCDTEWDDFCVEEVDDFGCGTCF